MSNRIVSQPSNDKYRENWERIWGKKEPQRFTLGGIPIETDERVPMNEIWARYPDGSIGPAIVGIDTEGPNA